MTSNFNPSTDHWRVFIRDLKVLLPCGINSWEKKGPQEVLISVEMWTDASQRVTSKSDISEMIDYRRVADEVLNEWPTRDHIPLLEQWAEELIDLCLADSKVTAAKVQLTKTAPYPQASGVGVELFRARK